MNQHESELDTSAARAFDVTFENCLINGLNYRIAISDSKTETQADTATLIILVHGFPECWYSWRHQFKALTAAGYRVAAPDIRGYGGSDCPEAIEAYDMQTLTADMAELAQQLSPEKPVVLVGHDWGAPIAWNSALLYPQHFSAVAGLSVPHVPPGEVLATDLFKKIFTDRGYFYYMLYFQQPGIAEQELQADPERSIRLFYTAIAGDAADAAWPQAKPANSRLFDNMVEPEMPRPWLSLTDVRYYGQQFAYSGFHGPLNRYRNFERDSVFLKSTGKTVVEQPSLFITGGRDMVAQLYPDGPITAMQPYVSDLRNATTLPGCGHWTQQERPEEVNKLIIDWLRSL